MRLLMGITKNEHGVFAARKKVPPELQEAVARVLGNGKARQTWLKKSLGTKDIAEANKRAKPVLIEFDRTLDRAKALIADIPPVSSLSPVLIKRMGEYHYAAKLALDDESMRIAPELEREFRASSPEITDWVEPVPEFGRSGGQRADATEHMPMIVQWAETALGKGDISYVARQIQEVCDAFLIGKLDKKSAAYHELGLVILRAEVKALRDIQQRDAGAPIETPLLPVVQNDTVAPAPSGATLRAAFEGWKRQRNRAPRTLVEYEYSIKLFEDLHGAIPVAQIRRKHVLKYREALQEVPRKRTGTLLKARLPELEKWGHEHPAVQKISAATVNKLLGGAQAVAVWARDNGIVPEDVDWADPFAGMRLDEAESERAPFETGELRAIFETPVFTQGDRPEGGQGEAAFWFPLLALFTGARRGELAGLRASDVAPNDLVGTVCVEIARDSKVGKRLKTRQSERVVPVHPQLTAIGFLDYVAEQAKARGPDAWLFPQVAPGTTGAASWTKWFGRYIGKHGVTDTAKVFHSFRHNFTDALRAAGVSDEVNRALVGHSDSGVHGRYGAKQMARRFGKRLNDAVASISYPGLDLRHLRNHRTRQGRRQAVSGTPARR